MPNDASSHAGRDHSTFGKKPPGTACMRSTDCASAHCGPLFTNGQPIAGKRVCCSEACSGLPCSGCAAITGRCVSLSSTRARVGNRCVTRCNPLQPTRPGCAEGYAALANSALIPALRHFVRGVRLRPQDARCAFGAAVSALLLSAEDTGRQLDSCEFPTTLGHVARYFWLVGGPNGLNISSGLFGAGGLLHRFKRQRMPQQLRVSATQHPVGTPLPFVITLLVAHRQGLVLGDRRGLGRLSLDCAKGVIRMGQLLKVGGRADQKKGLSLCRASLLYSGQRYVPSSTASHITYARYSTFPGAPIGASFDLLLRARSPGATPQAIRLRGTFRTRMTVLERLVVATLGDFLNLVINEPHQFLTGRSSDFSFEQFKPLIRKFRQHLLRQVEQWLNVVADDPHFSATIPGSLLAVDRQSVTVDQASVALLRALVAATIAGSHYLELYDFDFDFSDATGHKRLVCAKMLIPLRLRFLTPAKLSPTERERQLTAARKALINAATHLGHWAQLARRTASKDPKSHWARVLPSTSAYAPLEALSTLIGRALTTRRPVTLPMLVNLNTRRPLTIALSKLFHTPYFRSPGAAPAPFVCGKPTKTVSAIALSEALLKSWFDPVFSPNPLVGKAKWRLVTRDRQGKSWAVIDLRPPMRSVWLRFAPFFMVFHK